MAICGSLLGIRSRTRIDPDLSHVSERQVRPIRPNSNNRKPDSGTSALHSFAHDQSRRYTDHGAPHVAPASRSDPIVSVLATSREILRVPGEIIYRVPSLEVPAEEIEEKKHLLAASAVKLFIARARAAEPHFSPNRAVAALIGAICRRLDGIPLAIELAAARVAFLGVEGLALRLDDRFKAPAQRSRADEQAHQKRNY